MTAEGTALATTEQTEAAIEAASSVKLETGRYPSLDIVRVVRELAPIMHAARFYGTSGWEQAAAIMLVGYDLGFGLAGSFEFIHIIEGKPSISPRGALAKVLASGQLAAWKLSEIDGGFACWMKRHGGLEYGTVWTLEDARKAGLFKERSAWEKYPRNMCRWRCFGYVIDVLFPDLFGGLKRSDEYGAAVSEAGDVIIETAA